MNVLCVSIVSIMFLRNFFFILFLISLVPEKPNARPIESFHATKSFQNKRLDIIPTTSTGCGSQQIDSRPFKCHDGSCPIGAVRCNKIVECSDGSDEEQCSEFTIECPFKCRDKDVCIPKKLICDSKPDCPYGDDEEEKMCWQQKVQKWNQYRNLRNYTETLPPSSQPWTSSSYQTESYQWTWTRYNSTSSSQSAIDSAYREQSTYRQQKQGSLQNTTDHGHHNQNHTGNPNTVDVFKAVPNSGTSSNNLIFPHIGPPSSIDRKENGMESLLSPKELILQAISHHQYSPGSLVNIFNFQNIFQVLGSNIIEKDASTGNQNFLAIGAVLGSGNDVGNGVYDGNNNGAQK
ncbi:uncharacterized protein LOC141853804 isoform X1 [Brevipalpus obovatus]|uniref:uncharacterized protein LOC141853804 isoform X1 n=1 Tax=Brevipalpus obovatus TaxID=246614 RepID=UPI003D9E52B4